MHVQVMQFGFEFFVMGNGIKDHSHRQQQAGHGFQRCRHTAEDFACETFMSAWQWKRLSLDRFNVNHYD